VILKCDARWWDEAGRRLVGALDTILQDELPEMDLSVERHKSNARADLPPPKGPVGSPMLEVVVDGQGVGCYFGERTEAELKRTLREFL
jgi:hypothetical protein